MPIQLPYQRARWTTPDQDFIDVDWLVAAPTLAAARAALPPEGACLAWGGPAQRPAPTLMVMFHGLEGSSHSHYARAFASHAGQQGMDFAVAHFRGCSGEINLAPRAYHSGDHAEVDWILQRFRSEHAGPIIAVGVSLGGNALLRWAEEAGHSATNVVSAVAAICAPLDLAAGGWSLGRGFNRWTYTPMFLQTMKSKAMRKLQQHPGLFDRHALQGAHTLYDFDNVFTAPLHGFRNTEDYWARASAKPHLHAVRIPSLLVHARNDPFVPAWSLPVQRDVSSHVTLWQHAEGGHVGFAQGKPPGQLHYLPQAVGGWLQQHAA
ncbi:alpha/beta hydrolase [Rhodoferax lacus]|uniref:Alpha/beta hydrolase n=2 Tax=Rhodoferax lacus TaxID=2184758 RepID=A0A3E1R613_9BURK|nr:alpha/beta hydrolase [Rhodoferax lacus]